ncbi:MAG: 4Fe-4S ferredoxin [Desulfobulbaceae bacterium A2]|nr:MAG: 4Fe-4S ferredoxin [Desulfobulbaceae bacterium A2]
MKSLRKIIEIDEELCNGCGQCVPDCAEGSLEIIDGKARLVAEKYCDGLGACLKSCPTGALKVVERESEAFDEHAVEAYLAAKKQPAAAAVSPAATGCPSAKIQLFAPTATSCQAANAPALRPGVSALGHWPVQIRLIPPTAPFLQGCNLLVAADCCAVAYAGLQDDFLRNRVVMMGCPKFDDAAMYVQRFTEIFRSAHITSLTMLIMEVPCCGAMGNIIRQALTQSGAIIPVREVVIGTDGSLRGERNWE